MAGLYPLYAVICRHSLLLKTTQNEKKRQQFNDLLALYGACCYSCFCIVVPRTSIIIPAKTRTFLIVAGWRRDDTQARLVFQRSSERYSGPRPNQSSLTRLAVLVSPCRVHNPRGHSHGFAVCNLRQIRAWRSQISGRRWRLVRHRLLGLRGATRQRQGKGQ